MSVGKFLLCVVLFYLGVGISARINSDGSYVYFREPFGTIAFILFWPFWL